MNNRKLNRIMLLGWGVYGVIFNLIVFWNFFKGEILRGVILAVLLILLGVVNLFSSVYIYKLFGINYE